MSKEEMEEYDAATIKADIIRVAKNYDTKFLLENEVFKNIQTFCDNSDDKETKALSDTIKNLQNNLSHINGSFKTYQKQKVINEFAGEDKSGLTTFWQSMKTTFTNSNIVQKISRVFHTLKLDERVMAGDLVYNQPAAALGRLEYVLRDHPIIPVVDPYILTPEEKRVNMQSPKDQAKFEKIQEATKGNVKLVGEVDGPTLANNTPEITKTVNSERGK